MIEPLGSDINLEAGRGTRPPNAKQLPKASLSLINFALRHICLARRGQDCSLSGGIACMKVVTRYSVVASCCHDFTARAGRDERPPKAKQMLFINYNQKARKLQTLVLEMNG